MRHRWPGIVVIVVVLVAVGFLGWHVAHRQHSKIPHAPVGWALRFADEFQGPRGALPSAARWRFDTGHGYPSGPLNWGTSEIENYTDDPSNVALDGRGHLLITPRRDLGGNWSSARIESVQDDFTAQAGGLLRIEARLQLPNVTGDAALGYWPAFWMLGQSFRQGASWPRMGEFDIMENVNGIDGVWGTLHCGVYPLGPCREPLGLGGRTACPVIACQRAFHTFAFEWDRSVAPQQLRWYVDGRLYHSVSEMDLPASVWTAMGQQKGFFLLFDVAIGGSFADTLAIRSTPTETTSPDYPMVVDYVAVWTRTANSKTPFPMLSGMPP